MAEKLETRSELFKSGHVINADDADYGFSSTRDQGIWILTLQESDSYSYQIVKRQINLQTGKTRSFMKSTQKWTEWT